MAKIELTCYKPQREPVSEQELKGYRSLCTSQLDNIDRERARLEKVITTCRANLQVVQILEGER